MRFRTKFDIWLLTVLGFIGFAVAARVTLLAAHTRGFPFMAVAMGVVFVIALTLALPQYYEIRKDGLFIRQGWSRSLIRYQSILSATSSDSLASAPLFSSRRVVIESSDQGSFLIAPVDDRERFIDELKARIQSVAEPAG